ncbi:MAG: PilZ domain-containing protein [Vulcanimicrobiaceae bacterium]
MFAALTGWYTGCERNRRRYPRVKREFDVEYTLDGNRWDFAQGVDLSGGGMCMIGFAKIMPDAFEARIDIDNHTITMRLRKVWSTTTNHRGKDLPYYGLQFDRIDPKDWEAVMRSITGRNSPPAERFEPMPLDEADANKLLPPDFRDSLIQALKSRARIDTQRPQVAFEYGGMVYEKNKRMHQFTIRSSVNNYAGLTRFTSRILVNDEDDTEVIFLT